MVTLTYRVCTVYIVHSSILNMRLPFGTHTLSRMSQNLFQKFAMKMCSKQWDLGYQDLREDMVHIAYAPLEASAVVIREVCGCTPIRVRLTVWIVTTRYLQRFRTVLQGLNSRHYTHSK